MPTQHSTRTRELHKLILREALDALVITSPADWFYLTGFTGEAGALIADRRGLALVTDGRFIVQAGQELRGVAVVEQKDGLFRTCGDLLRTAHPKRVGFDANQLTVQQSQLLKKAAGGETRFVAVTGLVQSLRARKDAGELAQMRKAAALASAVIESAIGLLKPGVREFEIAAEIEYTAKRLRKNELVVLDVGAILGKYCSDITRTVYVGKAPARVRLWYQAVREAQTAAIESVEPGRSCSEVDAAARGILASYKLDRYFIHSTGHGLGLEVHEEPRLARGQKTRLASGNVITVEPGVYFAGVGGIRIEDDVVVHEGRSEVLTRASRDFIEL